MAHHIGTGEPCLPMEEQRGWSPGQEDPSCLQWNSSRSRRTGPTGRQPLLIRGQRAVSGREDPYSRFFIIIRHIHNHTSIISSEMQVELKKNTAFT